MTGCNGPDCCKSISFFAPSEKIVVALRIHMQIYMFDMRNQKISRHVISEGAKERIRGGSMFSKFQFRCKCT